MIKPPFHYFPIGSRSGVFLASLMTIFISSLFVPLILVDLFVGGRGFFVRKSRNGSNRPKSMNKYGTHQYRHLRKQNITLHYVEAGESSNQIMLMVHGFPECWFSWRHQIKQFSTRYHVIAVNMKGFGESDKPEGVQHYTSDKMVLDLIEFIETLQTSGKKIILAAHDWGGVLCWVVVQQRPDLIDRFIALNAPHPSFWNGRIQSNWKQFLISCYIYFFNCPLLAETYFLSNDLKTFDRLFGQYASSPEETEVYKCYFSLPNGMTGPLNYYRAALRGYESLGLGSRLATNEQVQPKTCIIWGRSDISLVSELADDSAKLCKDATVHYIDSCSHWTQIDQPDKVNQIMLEFLETK